ncbi:hypothetical protein BH23ACT3_BH23ACT3_19500 [soil metagenome]
MSPEHAPRLTATRQTDSRHVGRAVTEHELLDHLLRSAIEAAGGVSFAGFVNRLSESLDQHYFDVRRYVAATRPSGEWVQASLRHLNTATFDTQVGRDLEGVRRHLEAHIESCPLLDEPCSRNPDQR